MLRIDRAAVDAANEATSADDLAPLVQKAVELEFSTIPPYLTAMLSLKPGRNREIWWDIHDIVVDEMLHMAIACNLLNALGRRPVIADSDFLPDYPSRLPLGVTDELLVGLEPFSHELLRKVFMEIEEPEKVLVIPGPSLREALPTFATIGEFYRELRNKFADLGDTAFAGDPARQLVVPEWYPAERLFAITDAVSAVRAIELIIEEGEGTPTKPLDPDGDVAHYYRFEAIVRGRRLVRDPSVAIGFSYTGDPYPFDAEGVWPMTPNQVLAALDPKTEARRRANQFQITLSRLLNALQRVFDGEPAHFDAAMGIMFELKLAGQVLAGTPVVVNGQPTGLTAGPVFEYVVVNV